MRVGRFVVLGLSCALLVGCGGDDNKADESKPTNTSTTAEDGTTLPGTELALGEPAVVHFAPDPKHASTLKVVVASVNQGKIKDLSQYTLNDSDKKSNVFYVKASVENTGQADLAGEFVPLYGKVSESLVVQPVTFGSTFKRCDYQPLPKNFVMGKKAKICVVLLAPDHGRVSAIEWRGPDEEAPISWAATP